MSNWSNSVVHLDWVPKNGIDGYHGVTYVAISNGWSREPNYVACMSVQLCAKMRYVIENLNIYIYRRCSYESNSQYCESNGEGPHTHIQCQQPKCEEPHPLLFQYRESYCHKSIPMYIHIYRSIGLCHAVLAQPADMARFMVCGFISFGTCFS